MSLSFVSRVWKALLPKAKPRMAIDSPRSGLRPAYCDYVPEAATSHPGFLTDPDDIKAWLHKYFKIEGAIHITNDSRVMITAGGRYYHGDIVVHRSKWKRLKYIEVDFLSVEGEFRVSGCEALRTLIGAPDQVGGDFSCAGCIKLTNLVGAPRIVRDFSASYCTALTTLTGAPQLVMSSFRCTRCTHLKSLIGAPVSVVTDFECSGCTALPTLEGAPLLVGWWFNCADCLSLETLDGFPAVPGVRNTIGNCPKIRDLSGLHLAVAGASPITIDVPLDDSEDAEELKAEIADLLPAHKMYHSLTFTDLPEPSAAMVLSFFENEWKLDTDAKAPWISIVQTYKEGAILEAVAQFEDHYNMPFPMPATVISDVPAL